MERRGIGPGAIAPAAYGNGVLVLAMPIMESGHLGHYTEFRLEVIEATRGQRVGHTSSDLRPTTTAEHRRHIEDQTAPELDKP